MKGYAPGWQVRCTKCGRTRDAAGVGTTKIGTSSCKSYTLGWCSNCRRFRFAAIEKKPERAQSELAG